MKVSRILKRTLIVFLVVIILSAAGMLAYISDYYHADDAAVEAMAVEGITVQSASNQMVFAPDEPEAGFIFYPGGKVEYTAYAPLMEQLAERGILCVLVKMPGNLAVLDINAADHPEELDGLILLGAYTTADLSDTDLSVLTTYGSEDGVLSREKYSKGMEMMPADVTELVIQGGCHAGFGSYGPQKGDGTPTISGEDQVEQTVEAIVTSMEEWGRAA